MAYPRITYNSIDVDFDRGLSAFDAWNPQDQTINENPFTREIETLNFADQWNLSLLLNNCSSGLLHQLEAFYEYVKNKTTFSFKFDPDLKAYFSYEGKTLNSNDAEAPLTTSGTMAYPAGKFGLGLNITNQTVYYDVDDFFADPPPKGTIAFWFAPNFVVSSNAVDHTLFQIDSTSGDPVSAAYFTSGEYFLWGVNAAASSPIVLQSSVASFLQNEFHHYCVTWDSTIANGGKMYLDGVLVASSTNSSFTVKSTGTNFRIGYNGTDYANGVFDDFLIRSDVLTDAQIFEIGNGNTALPYRKNTWTSLYYDGQFEPELQAGTPLYTVAMNFREAL